MHRLHLQISNCLDKQFIAYVHDWEFIWISFVILYWRAVNNSSLGSWPSASKQNSSNLESDFSSLLCVFPHKQLSFLSVIVGSASYSLSSPLEYSLVLITTKVLTLVALDLMALLGLPCGPGLSISSLVKAPKLSSLSSWLAALQKLCSANLGPEAEPPASYWWQQKNKIK